MSEIEKNLVRQKIVAKNGSSISGVTQIDVQNVFSSEAPHRVPFQVPSLTEDFVDIPEIKREIKSHLLNGSNPKGILAITAIQGLGGIGKTTLAIILANDKETQKRFSDGILWATLGQESGKLSLLNSWIQALGDYRSTYTTVQAASNHLRALLHDKHTLLVIDDAWDSSDVKPFLVGGSNCQTLITTRKSFIAEDLGAKCYSLDVMTKEQSLELFKGILKDYWDENEKEDALKVAKDVGYLPLALNLAAKKRKRDYSWLELHEALEEEIALLSVLESPRRLRKGEESLEASLNLSLRDLNTYDKEVWENFVWLGVLPEDTKINKRMVSTLWDMGQKEAEETLELLWEEGLLIQDLENQFGSEKLKTYRVHDLFHDIARYYLTLPVDSKKIKDLPGLGLKIKDAHDSLLNRYHSQTQKKGLWHTLKDDTYVHSHLTWHMEKAERIEDIHTLLREENENGKNGWYEALESLGQNSIFIEDVIRAWNLSEKESEHKIEYENKASSIGLEVRYALIYTSINSLSAKIPEELLVALLETKKWTASKVFIYALKEPDPFKRANKLISIYRKINEESEKEEVLDKALDAASKIKGGYKRSQALIAIVPNLNGQKKKEAIGKALDAAYNIEADYERTCALSAIAPHLNRQKKKEVIRKALAIAYKIQYGYKRSLALLAIAANLDEQKKEEVIKKALTEALKIKTNDRRSLALLAIAPNLKSEQKKEEIIEQALTAALKITFNYRKSLVLSAIVPNLNEQKKEEVIKKALTAASKNKDNYQRSRALSAVIPSLDGQKKEQIMKKALATALRIEDTGASIRALSAIAPHLDRQKKEEVIIDVLAAAYKIKDDHRRADVLLDIASSFNEQKKEEVIKSALNIIPKIEDDYKRAKILLDIASNFDTQKKEEVIKNALNITPRIEDNYKRAEVLLDIASNFEEQKKEEILGKALAVAYKIENDEIKSRVLLAIVIHLKGQKKEELLVEALDIASKIKSQSIKSQTLSAIVPNLNEQKKEEVMGEALAAAYKNENIIARTWRLLYIVPIFDGQKKEEVIIETLATAYRIDDDYQRSRALSAIVPNLNELNKEEVIEKTLAAAYRIEDTDARVRALSAIIPYLDRQKKEEVLEIIFSSACRIQDAIKRSRALTTIVPYLEGQKKEKVIVEVLGAAHLIKSVHSRIDALFAIISYLEGQKKEKVLEEVLSVAFFIKDDYYRAEAINIVLLCLKNLPSNNLYFWWREIIKILRERTRDNLFVGIAAFTPIIDKLSTDNEMYEISKAIKDVSRWWP